MTYRVTIVPHAKRQLLEQALWWSKHRSAEQAFDWLAGFEKSLQSLAKSPGKKPTHRAVFEIRESDVIVHSIRHLAQADLSQEDI